MSRIAGRIRVQLCANEFTILQRRVSFSMALIEVDVTEDLPCSVILVDENGVEFDQKVTYDWVPIYCHKCVQPRGKVTAKWVKKQVVDVRKEV